MKFGLSIFLVYALGKAITFAIHGFDFTVSTLPVLFWQDLLAGVFVACVARYSERSAAAVYALLLIHFAVSMPLLRIMATPLTAPLLRAGSGTLADSMRHHLDVGNLALVFGTVTVGILLPIVLRGIRFRFRPGFAILGGFAVISGYILTPSADLRGLHRNSVFAFAQSFSSATEPEALASTSSPEHRRSSLHARLSGANVLLVGLESTGAKHLSTYGAATDPMPFLAHLAQNGIVFENAYAAYPESIKGLFTLLFSRQPEFGFDPEDLGPHGGPSLASVARCAGYDTALFHSGRFMYLGMDKVVAVAGFDRAEDAGAVGGNHNSSFGVDDFATVDHLLAWLDHRNSTKPFFIHYLPISGHHPYESPGARPFRGGDDQSRYLSALHYSDLALKRLVDGLEERGVLENTLLVIYGDHGEAFGEHAGNYGHTLHLFEENVRVPLIFWMPAKLNPTRLDHIVSLVDVGPTICDLLGFEIPPAFEGASAFTSEDRPAFFLTEYSMRIYGMRFGNWKFIFEKNTGFVRLYDLKSDLAERTNLAAARPDVVSNFQRRILEWRRTAPPPTIIENPEIVAQR